MAHAAIHLPWMGLPPSGFHQWRQTQTLAVARNFHEESMNIFEPRVDSRGAGSGVAGMEFPLVNYAIALTYEVAGFSHSAHRVTMLAFSMIGILGCYSFARRLLDSESLALASAALLVFSPLFCYYSVTALPDVPSLSLLFLSLGMLLRFIDGKGRRFALAAAALLVAAALMKLHALTMLPAIAYLLYRARATIRAMRTALAALAVGMLAVGAWYVYARWLSSTNRISDFILHPTWPQSVGSAGAVVWKVFVQWLPELYVSYAAFILVVIGTIVVFQRRDHPARGFLAVGALGLLAYFIAEMPMFEIHDYYAMPFLVLLVPAAAIGVGAMASWCRGRASRSAALVSLLVLVAILGSARALSRFSRVDPDRELIAMEEHLDRTIGSRHELVVAASDHSPSIYLYFMHRKGWTVTDDVDAARLRDMVRAGARYLVSDSRSLESREEIGSLLEPRSRLGRFHVFRLRERERGSDSGAIEAGPRDEARIE